jgi:small-conductance mechanosensitive channel/DNA-binding CsgD family transcriptional regulator
MTGWLIEHSLDIIFPLLVFISIAVLGLWSRWIIHKVLKQQKREWVGKTFVIESIYHPFLLWFLILGAYVAILISIVSPTVKRLSGEGMASLFAISLILTIINLSGKFIRFYLGKTKVTQSLISTTLNIIKIIIIVIGILVIMDIWGANTFPVIILLSVGLFLLGLAFRNTFDNFLAGLEIAYSEHIKVGHLIKLESGETGHVTRISWTRTTIETGEGNLVIIPNYKLMANSIINYGAVSAVNAEADVQRNLADVEPRGLIDSLTVREREVLKLIGLGATNREIADKLIISEHTVKSHLRSILNKLNIRNRQQAAVYAEREGLVVGTEPVKTSS